MCENWGRQIPGEHKMAKLQLLYENIVIIEALLTLHLFYLCMVTCLWGGVTLGRRGSTLPQAISK